MYIVAIKDSAAWAGDSPADLSMIGFWNLVIVWLKVSLRAEPYHLCLEVDPYSSFLYPGASSDYGRCWTGWIPRRI